MTIQIRAWRNRVEALIENRWPWGFGQFCLLRNPMGVRFVVLLGVLMMLGTLSPQRLRAQTDDVPSLQEFEKIETKAISLVDRCMAASVGLGSEAQVRNGSAVVVSQDGLVLTAYHVIAQLPKENMVVYFPDGRTAKAKKLGGNPKLDVAMVKIIDDGPFPFVEVGDYSQVNVGDWCVSMSHAGGFQANRTPPVRMGQVIDKNRGGFMQISSALIGGDSGGPTFDLEGRVIGIHSNIGANLRQNNACPISDFTNDGHWKRMIAGEVWKQKNKVASADKGVELPPKKADGTQVVPGKSAEAEDSRQSKEVSSGKSAIASTLQSMKSIVKSKAPVAENNLVALQPLGDNLKSGVVRIWRNSRHIVSGTIVSQNLIATKSSELRTRNFEIELPGGQRIKGQIAARIKQHDLLLIRTFESLSPVSLGRIEPLPLGTFVAAIGYKGVPTAMGVVSVETRNLNAHDYGVVGIFLDPKKKMPTVIRVSPRSGAAAAGLKIGDVIVGIDGTSITTLEQLKERIKSTEAGSVLPIEFVRNGATAGTLLKMGSRTKLDQQTAGGYPTGGRLSRQRTNFELALQTDVPFKPNQAGTPLINLRGEVVGINIARAGRIKSYALPVQIIINEMAKLD